MPIFLSGPFSSVALGHLLVDMLNGSRPVLLTYLGLGETEIGLISTIYVWGSSLSQPLFGWIADRVGVRWLAAGGVFWMMIFYSLAIFLPLPSALICLILASLGSGAFHPVGAMQATLQGRIHLGGKETTAASYFFTFGQFGLFLGPVLAGYLLGGLGTQGLVWLSVFALPIGLNLLWNFRSKKSPKITTIQDQTIPPGLKVGTAFIFVLALVAALQSWAQQNMINFLPKYLSTLGQSEITYGNMAGFFMGGSALGNVVGGYLGDRFRKTRVAATALILGSIPLYIISRIGWSPWLYVLVPLAGALTGAVHSIIVVIAQRSLPGGMAMVSGATLGFIFSAGALGLLLTGPVAERFGFPAALLMTSVLVLVASGLAYSLKEPKNNPEAVSP